MPPEPGRPEPRRPGQSNEAYERRGEARRSMQRDLLGPASLAGGSGGGDPSVGLRVFRALFAWRDRRRR